MNQFEREQQPGTPPKQQGALELVMVDKPWEEDVRGLYIEGRDYITDFFKVLGVTSDSSDEEIHRAYLGMAGKYHPDRFQGLADEYRLDAEFMMGVINRANQTLSDPEARKAHANELNEWDGPVSSNGKPVYIPFRPSRMPSEFVDVSPNSTAELLKGILKTDEATFRLIESLYESTDSPDPKLTAAYRSALASRQEDIDTEEMLERGILGMGIDTSSSPPLAYLETTRAELAVERRRLEESFIPTEGQISGRQQHLLSSEEEGDSDPFGYSLSPLERAENNARRIEVFNQRSEQITELARQKQELMNKRLALVDGIYPDGQVGYADKFD